MQVRMGAVVFGAALTLTACGGGVPESCGPLIDDMKSEISVSADVSWQEKYTDSIDPMLKDDFRSFISDMAYGDFTDQELAEMERQLLEEGRAAWDADEKLQKDADARAEQLVAEALETCGDEMVNEALGVT